MMNIKKVYNQELYQGEKIKKEYFEGWYFKNTTKAHTISFIPGISKGKDKHAFIQVINNINNKSYYIRYNYEDFSFNHDPFYIKIKDNFFSKELIHIDIEDKIIIKGELSYNNLTPIKTNTLMPNIMGPFAYIRFMECYHGVISLKHNIMGSLIIDGNTIDFDNGIGYIEKDYGTSFPSSYIWLEANKSNDMIFFSYARIPFKIFKFKGLISCLYIDGKEYRFATYNLSKVKIFKKLTDNTYYIKIKKRNYVLELYLKCGDSIDLISPKNGNMNDTIYESLSSEVKVILIKGKKELYSNIFNACTSEIYNIKKFILE